jgi:drug/metabolite transporter (DMT)-like permease
MRAGAVGALLAAGTAVIWGGQFVVGKSALGRVDAFHLTAIRYFFAAGILLALLVAVEGRGALALGGRSLRLLWLGTLGFAGFNLLAYAGLTRARPESAALVSALGPLLMAVVIWLRSRARPTRATTLALVVALLGVALVISRGDPASILRGSIGWGDALVLGGVLSMTLYMLGASEFRHFSPLRYTALTAGLGWLSIAAVTVVVTATGLEPLPSVGAVGAIVPQIAYVTVFGAVVAVLAWNAAVGKIGAQNVAVFGNLIPVTTFAIQIVRGYRPGRLELLGAAITVGALLAANAAARSRASSPVVRDEAEPALAEAA